MKTTLIAKLALALSIICSAAFGQNEKYLVVSVSGELDITLANQLTDDIILLATESDLFSVLPGEKEFQQELLKARNEKGVVNDATIEEIAKNARANYLCIANINTLFDGKKRIMLKLFDLKLNQKEPMQYISNGGTDPIELENSTQLTNETRKAVKQMLDGFKSKTKQEEPEAPKVVYVDKSSYQYFTKAERFGTFILNHALGLGSYMIMDDLASAGGILAFVSSSLGFGRTRYKYSRRFSWHSNQSCYKKQTPICATWRKGI